jgi:hypothetical protein
VPWRRQDGWLNSRPRWGDVGVPLRRAYFSSSVPSFLEASSESVLAALTLGSAQEGFPVEVDQLAAWREEALVLKEALKGIDGQIFLEFSIPRMGLRADAVLLAGSAVYVLEFKVGASTFSRPDREQVWDYALDLKNFHETSHDLTIVPILVATRATAVPPWDGVIRGSVPEPLPSSAETLPALLRTLCSASGGTTVDEAGWEQGRYSPTPTIIEAALALYKRHSVADISRSDAAAKNLTSTAETVEGIVRDARDASKRVICFVTGVPGAGKTLAGLNIATKSLSAGSPWQAVYLSGNGPLVQVLTEALARDRRTQLQLKGTKARLGLCRSEVKAFIQNVHHFRDEYLRDESPPHEHVTIFDEAQRAWTKRQSASFMKRKRGRSGFSLSEPGFLISCLDRHKDWAAVICLVGGGQEINTGEAGIGEWLDSVQQTFPDWEVHVSDRLSEREYASESALSRLKETHRVYEHPELHLGVSLRSFRAEHLSTFVSELLAIELHGARDSLSKIPKYPLRVTRSLTEAKEWLRQSARGSERYGLVVSSRAERLKPHAIDVRAQVNPVHWFLDGRTDTRSSFYLEDAATEFQVQGLELDWSCVVWDADLRFTDGAWSHFEFKGRGWQRIRAVERKRYLENTYRVLLTRARQGMVVVVPPGDSSDPTRDPSFYDPTFDWLKRVGIPEL